MREDFKRVDNRFESRRVDDKLEDFRKEVISEFKRVDARFAEQDAKSDRLRLEIKSDIQRVEDRTTEANEFHAKSVALLDGILRHLQVRREPL